MKGSTAARLPRKKTLIHFLAAVTLSFFSCQSSRSRLCSSFTDWHRNVELNMGNESRGLNGHFQTRKRGIAGPPAP